MPDPLLYLKAMGLSIAFSVLIVLPILTMKRSAALSWLNPAIVGGMALGLAAGYGVLSFQPALPPASGLDRFLAIIVPLALAIELIAGFESVSRRFVWLLRLGLAAILPRILLHGSGYLNETGEWPLWQMRTVMVLCGALLAVVWYLLHRLSDRTRGPGIAFALSLTNVCAGLTIMMAGYIKGGAAALPLAATLFGVTSAAWLRNSPTTAVSRCGTTTAIGIGLVGLFSLLFIGRFFGRISSEFALVMFCAPLLCWVTEWPGVKKRQRWLSTAMCLLLVALPLLAVLVVAKRNFDRDMAPLLDGTTRVESKDQSAGLTVRPRIGGHARLAHSTLAHSTSAAKLRRTRPGRAFVCSSSDNTSVPLTMT